MAIGGFFKNVGSIFQNAFRQLFGRLFTEDARKKLVAAGRAILEGEIGRIAWTVVRNLNEENITNEQKRSKALDDIGKQLKKSGKEVRGSFVSLLIELAVQRLKGVIPGEGEEDEEALEAPTPAEGEVPVGG